MEIEKQSYESEISHHFHYRSWRGLPTRGENSGVIKNSKSEFK